MKQRMTVTLEIRLEGDDSAQDFRVKVSGWNALEENPFGSADQERQAERLGQTVAALVAELTKLVPEALLWYKKPRQRLDIKLGVGRAASWWS